MTMDKLPHIEVPTVQIPMELSYSAVLELSNTYERMYGDRPLTVFFGLGQQSCADFLMYSSEQTAIMTRAIVNRFVRIPGFPHMWWGVAGTDGVVMTRGC